MFPPHSPLVETQLPTSHVGDVKLMRLAGRAPVTCPGARLTQVFQKVMLSLSGFMGLGGGKEQQTQSHLLRDLASPVKGRL